MLNEIEMLERLAAMWKNGTLSDAEFERQKQEILRSITSAKQNHAWPNDDQIELGRASLFFGKGPRLPLIFAAATLLLISGIAITWRLFTSTQVDASNTSSANTAETVAGRDGQVELAPQLTGALQAGYTLVACKGQAKEVWRLDGIHPTPESYPDRVQQHPITIMFRVKWGATPPFDIYNPASGEWAKVCDRNCVVLGRPDKFTATKGSKGSAQFPGGVAEDMEFHYDGQTAKMRLSRAENVTEAGADPRLRMVGITHDDKYFSGQCKHVQKHSDIPT